MESASVLKLLGMALIVTGIIIAFFGDRELPENGIFSSRYPSFIKKSPWLKWPIAAALIYAGVEVAVHP